MTISSDTNCGFPSLMKCFGSVPFFMNQSLETLVVVTKQERPYVMLKKGFKGNAAYDGFAIDLLKVSF